MKKQFKAESKRLLELMIHSIYTHSDIFLRELVSNASDAIDKLYFKSLKENLNLDKFQIEIKVDKENRVIEIKDNGIGMNKSELETNLGTIAKSDSFAFKQANDTNEVDVIGQFGVGFYSSFIVGKKVEVISKKFGDEQGHIFKCENVDGFVIEPYEVESFGTTVRVYIHDNNEENYDNYLDTYYIEHLIKKYSDYIRYPILLEKEVNVFDEQGNVKEVEIKNEVINSMVPIWKKNKGEIIEEQYNQFYREKFLDHEDPLTVIHSNVEGNISFNALLYIPSHLPSNYYSNEFKKGLQLYSRGVYINDNIEELLPDYFRFVKGLVDSYDLSLNISREMLQHNRQLNSIAKILEKKIKQELMNLLKNNREKYEQFFEVFGSQLKYGIYQDFGMNKKVLEDLLLFKSSKSKQYVTLDEYIDGKEEKIIYYASGDNVQSILDLPQVEALILKGKEVLLLDDRIDEFAITMLREYKGYQFKNTSDSDVELLNKDEQEDLKLKLEANKTLLEFMKETLKDSVSDVILSKKLIKHPVCLSSSNGISLEMEKTINALPNQEKIHANKVLEINSSHPIFESLQEMHKKDIELLKKMSYLLYQQALLIEGFALENPIEFSKNVCDLMILASQNNK